MDIQEQIKQQVETHPIMLFMKGTPDFPQCGFSAQSVAALKACGADFAAANVLDSDELRQGIKDYSQWPTIPQLYVNGEFIGGCDILVEMYHKGELQELIDGAKAAA